MQQNKNAKKIEQSENNIDSDEKQAGDCHKENDMQADCEEKKKLPSGNSKKKENTVKPGPSKNDKELQKPGNSKQEKKSENTVKAEPSKNNKELQKPGNSTNKEQSENTLKTDNDKSGSNAEKLSENQGKESKNLTAKNSEDVDAAKKKETQVKVDDVIVDGKKIDMDSQKKKNKSGYNNSKDNVELKTGNSVMNSTNGQVEGVKKNEPMPINDAGDYTNSDATGAKAQNINDLPLDQAKTE